MKRKIAPVVKFTGIGLSESSNNDYFEMATVICEKKQKKLAASMPSIAKAMIKKLNTYKYKLFNLLIYLFSNFHIQ